MNHPTLKSLVGGRIIDGLTLQGRSSNEVGGLMPGTLILALYLDLVLIAYGDLQCIPHK